MMTKQSAALLARIPVLGAPAFPPDFTFERSRVHSCLFVVQRFLPAAKIDDVPNVERNRDLIIRAGPV